MAVMRNPASLSDQLPLFSMFKVLITGPESSGKSYLAKNLAIHFGGELVEEFARIYLRDKEGYDISDLLEIAKGQLNLERLLAIKNPSMLFCDTGIEVVKIWSQVKFGDVSPLINEMSDYSTYDLILLCEPNIAWEYDPIRENQSNRYDLLKLYKEELTSSNCKWYNIDAKENSRLKQAISIVESSIQ